MASGTVLEDACSLSVRIFLKELHTMDRIDSFVAAARKVGAAGLTVCSSGNLSWRYGDEVLISGTGSWLPELRREQVAVVDFKTGRSLNGVKPSMEHTFHLGVMREREEVNVVLHFQSPYATAMACSKQIPADLNVTAELPCHVGATIPCVPYRRPGSPQLAQAVIEAMREHHSILLLKHGQVTCGKDFNQAFERAMFLEMACRIAILNRGEFTVLTEEELLDIKEAFGV